MGAKTKIDWCDSTWNPVTGCYHGCKYCYARRIAERFDGRKDRNDSNSWGLAEKRLHVYDGMVPHSEWNELEDRKTENLPYPYGFEPTLHMHKLDLPQRWKKPRTIFVCSMADLFGAWVPDKWIESVFKACAAAPQHRYLFLTKNQSRYSELMQRGIALPNTIDWMYGFTLDGEGRLPGRMPLGYKVFCSIEPILKKPDEQTLDIIALTGWCIVGAETGNRKGKVIPEKGWIDAIVRRCREAQIPVFMKESLRGLMGGDFIRERPWDWCS